MTYEGMRSTYADGKWVVFGVSADNAYEATARAMSYISEAVRCDDAYSTQPSGLQTQFDIEDQVWVVGVEVPTMVNDRIGGIRNSFDRKGRIAIL